MNFVGTCEQRLLVDIEHGKVLRADQEVEITTRLINTHPFLDRKGRQVIAGDPKGETVIYDVVIDLGDQLTIRRQPTDEGFAS